MSWMFLIALAWSLVVLGIGIGGWHAEKAVTKQVRTEAVEHGHAEWIVSPDGTTEFKWKDKP